VALIGDACACLTLIAGQGSHMAMAGGYVLAQKLAREPDHASAFAAYERLLKPHADAKQRDARRFARVFVPGPRSLPWLRRLVIRAMFSKLLIGAGAAFFGGKSVLRPGPA
jgi:2-polyprenyl-6-methoxyphenol hydroxylase-like FAD-dependent oxidoreductase